MHTLQSAVAMATIHPYLLVVTWSTVEKEELSVSGTTTIAMVTA